MDITAGPTSRDACAALFDSRALPVPRYENLCDETYDVRSGSLTGPAPAPPRAPGVHGDRPYEHLAAERSVLRA
ncbi:hypothetical protein [Kitasatospora phosalacinea]|uniref:hypothetical protein n=1 Tax=Kitasatospora phosalacinea TaxID=2065 RepID=UPI0005248D25|nr:hypothetical protein [Kitasatospora phosalacinea]